MSLERLRELLDQQSGGSRSQQEATVAIQEMIKNISLGNVDLGSWQENVLACCGLFQESERRSLVQKALSELKDSFDSHQGQLFAYYEKRVANSFGDRSMSFGSLSQPESGTQVILWIGVISGEVECLYNPIRIHLPVQAGWIYHCSGFLIIKKPTVAEVMENSNDHGVSGEQHYLQLASDLVCLPEMLAGSSQQDTRYDNDFLSHGSSGAFGAEFIQSVAGPRLSGQSVTLTRHLLIGDEAVISMLDAYRETSVAMVIFATQHLHSWKPPVDERLTTAATSVAEHYAKLLAENQAEIDEANKAIQAALVAQSIPAGQQTKLMAQTLALRFDAYGVHNPAEKPSSSKE